jgi:hypothetical protein
MILAKDKFITGVAYLHDLRLMVEVYSGKLSLKAMKAFKLDQSVNPEFNFEYNVLTIQNSILIDGLLTEVVEYVQFLTEQKTIAGKRKVATVVETPNQAVYSSVLKNFQDKLPQEFVIYNNLDDALQYLDLLPHTDLIKAKIQELVEEPNGRW